jgi:hypothetical protein
MAKKRTAITDETPESMQDRSERQICRLRNSMVRALDVFACIDTTRLSPDEQMKFREFVALAATSLLWTFRAVSKCAGPLDRIPDQIDMAHMEEEGQKSQLTAIIQGRPPDTEPTRRATVVQ